MLEFTFAWEDVIDWKEDEWLGKVVVMCYKCVHLSGGEWVVLINGNGWHGWQLKLVYID